MPLPRFLNAVYAWARGRLIAAVERASWSGAEQAKAATATLEGFDRTMEGRTANAAADRDSWGESRSAEAAQNAMLAISGGG